MVIVEIGGTVGDIESLPFLEAIRQMRLELGPENAIFVHVTLVPFIAAAGELKTKPTQHSVKEMLSIGIQPDLLLCRSDRALPREMKAKIALFCNIAEIAVITAQDVDTIYEVPVALAQEGLDEQILRLLKLEAAAAQHVGVAGAAGQHAPSAGRGAHRRGGQVCRAGRCLQEFARGAAARRAGAQGAHGRSSGSKRRTWIRRRRRRAGWRTWTASWCRADSASAASKA